MFALLLRVRALARHHQYHLSIVLAARDFSMQNITVEHCPSCV